MKNQSKIDGQKTNQIFNTNFSKEILTHTSSKRNIFSFFTPLFSNHILTISIGSSLLILGIYGIFFLLLSTTSPLSLTKEITQVRQSLEESLEKSAQVANTIKDNSRDIQTLQVRGALDSIPELASSQDLFRRKINWFRIYVGIDQTVRSVVAGNNILKKIQIGSIIFKSKDQSVLLDRVRAIGSITNQDGSTNGSSISLATKIVDTLESSPYLKEVKTESYSNKKIPTSTSGSTIGEDFTPLTISALVQSPEEKNVNDITTSIDDELENIKNTTSPLPIEK